MRALSVKEGPHIEYLIAPDGTVTVRVRGLQGDEAHRIVDNASKQLGVVLKSGPVDHEELKGKDKAKA